MTVPPCRLLAVLLLLLWTSPASAGTGATVTKVYDGDTLVVAGVGTVRLLGIDCPELQASGRDRYYLRQGIPPAALRRTARQARAFTRDRALGRQVTLRFDRERTDRHGRTLAYLILPDGRMLNRLLLEEGLAAVYRRFDFRFKESFLALENRARLSGRGIWGRSSNHGDRILPKRGVAFAVPGGAQ